jgi:hypothetical protein
MRHPKIAEKDARAMLRHPRPQQLIQIREPLAQNPMKV